MSNRFTDKLCTFGGLTAAEVAALEAVTSHPSVHSARVDLIREGDRPGPMLIVLEGWAFRYKVLPNGSRQITAFLMPGDCCDLHVGMLAEMDHSIQTQTEALVAKVDRSDVERLLEEHPGIARALYISQLVDEGTLRAWIVSIGRRRSVERVAHLLLELYVRGSRSGIAINDTMALPLSQAVLADALGLTPVHINRVLQSLRASGVIELKRRLLFIQDPAALTRLSGFDDSYLHKRVRART